MFTQSIEAENATIVTSNARIDGNFHVSRSLDLRTSNQPIHAQVTLTHDAAQSDDISTNLTMVTANAYVPPPCRPPPYYIAHN